MNRIYRLVWSASRNAWVAACEFATAHGKAGRSVVVGTLAASLLCSPVASTFAATPYKNGSAFEKGVAGNPGLYVNDASNDSGCIFVHDTGATGSTGWKYDSDNTNCLTSDKASQTARVLFYGSGKRTDGTDSLTLGNELYVNGGRIGLNDQFGANPTHSMAIGNIGVDASGNPTGTRATAQDSIAIGNDAVASQQNAMALGTNAQANVADGVALGSRSVAGTAGGQPGYAPMGANQPQLDAINATTSTLGAIAVGDASNGQYRQITGLAAGSLDSDAVNVAQLKGVTGQLAQDALLWDPTSNGGQGAYSASHGGNTINRITNVAPGTLSPTSTDAVNGSQLNQTNQNVTNVDNRVSNVDNRVSNVFGDDSVTNIQQNGRGIRYVRTNDNGLPVTDAYAQGQGSTAVGYQATAAAANGIAMGRDASSLSREATAIGVGAKVDVDSSRGLAVGNNALVQGGSGIAVGNDAQTLSADAITLGNRAVVNHGATDSLALGNDSQVATDANKAVALGYGAKANASRSLALGSDAAAGAAGSVALGSGASVNDIGSTGSLALGQNSSVTGSNSVALGNGSNASSSNAMAMGNGARAGAASSIVLGQNANVTDSGSTGAVVIGQNGSALGANAIALGTGSSVTRANSVAIGRDASATALNSVALGARSSTSANLQQPAYVPAGASGVAGSTPAGEVSIGSAGSERRLTNLAAGAADTDGVNVSQLKTLGSQVADNDAGAVKYERNPDGTINYNSVVMQGDTYNSVSKTGGTKITNVARGSDDSDAVNMSQLNETNQNVSNVDNRVTNVDNRVSNVFGDDSDANVAENGRGIRYVRTNDNGLPVDDAYAKGQGSTAVGYQAQATGGSALALGRNASATADNSVALGAGSTTTANLAHPAYRAGGHPVMGNATGEVSVGSAGAERRVTNLAAGADETDAVNVSQLRGVADRTDQLAQDALLWDPAANGGNGAFSANHGGRGPNKITNVAAGDINADSTDAVNGSQLYEVTTQINNITLGGIKYFHANSQKPDSLASGTDSIAVGPAAQASGTSSLALGDGANASATNASAIGSNAAASGENATAVGTGASASGGSSVALGEGASATAERSSAIGAGASAQAANSVALGADSLADRDNSVSVGSAGNERQITNVKAGEADTDAVNVSQLRDHGDTINNSISNVDNRVTQAKTDITQLQNGTDGMFQVNNSSNLPKPRPTGTDAVAGGAGAEAAGNNSAAIGTRARASGSNATALGNGASAQAQNSVALGANSVADRANSVSVGSAGNERQITNVAAGTAPTDAVNVSQLQQSMGDISNQFYDYTDSRYNALRHDLKKQDDILSAGIAGAMAMATLPQPHSPGASMATVGLGNYRGQGALAIGVSRISDNGKWVTKLQGTTSSQGEAGVAVGVGYQW
ncbi:autotransporter adhesin [Pseudomonas nitritireducens]|uniref:Autotransporter adhesin n=1 Tax=Pseudomonas nitroreducens TaxID=46680 RepID=A0A7W7KJR1_PSENT|nr:YadA-like family protein [Pseudomonas nitritireducens]MBB4864102.1 autotransporter adhesin [Pseudomonas nitritireducens]